MYVGRDVIEVLRVREQLNICEGFRIMWPYYIVRFEVDCQNLVRVHVSRELFQLLIIPTIYRIQTWLTLASELVDLIYAECIVSTWLALTLIDVELTDPAGITWSTLTGIALGGWDASATDTWLWLTIIFHLFANQSVKSNLAFTSISIFNVNALRPIEARIALAFVDINATPGSCPTGFTLTTETILLVDTSSTIHARRARAFILVNCTAQANPPGSTVTLPPVRKVSAFPTIFTRCAVAFIHI